MARQFKLPDPVDVNSFATKTALNNAVAALPMYVGGGAWMTRAELKSNFPAGPDQLGKLARVSDLWGSVRTTMICEFDGITNGGYYWRPQRTDYARGETTQTSGNMTLIPLVTPPAIFFKANLVGAINVALGTTDVWPGCKFEISAPPLLNLNAFTITGLLGGLTTTLLGGGRKVAIYTNANGWEAS